MALLVFHGNLDELRGRVGPHRYVEEPGAGAVRRRIPTGPAWVTWIDEGAFGTWGLAGNTHRPATFIEAAGPGHLDERFSKQELTRRAVQHIKEAVPVGPE